MTMSPADRFEKSSGQVVKSAPAGENRGGDLGAGLLFFAFLLLMLRLSA